MAGRIFTKANGVAWKKAAASLLAENSHANSITPFQWDEKAYSSVSLVPSYLAANTSVSSSIFGTVGSQRSLTRSTISKGRGAPSTMMPASWINGRESLLKNLESRNFSFEALHCPVIQRSPRHYSSSASDKSGAPTSVDVKAGEPKVSIISSMLKEEKVGHDFMEKKEEPLADKNQDDGEKNDNEGKKKAEDPFMRSQRYAKWMLIGTFSFGIPMLVYQFGPPDRDENGNAIPDAFSSETIPIQYVKRAYNQLNLMKKDIVEPSSQKLLPDPMQAPYFQPPYTLVIELFDILLHPVYDQVHGWRFKKRPGIDYFLEQVGPPLYEIVIFTRENPLVAYPLIDSMDPKGYIMYRLFRDAARFKSGFQVGNILKGELPKLDPYYQKDLKYLNRDLRRVVVVDNDKRATELQPSNGISLKPWDGSSTDTELFDLAAFLRTVATNEVDDVRPVLEHYRKYEDPLSAFKLAQVRMREEQLKLAREMQENSGKNLLPNSRGGGSGFSVLANYFRSKN